MKTARNSIRIKAGHPFLRPLLQGLLGTAVLSFPALAEDDIPLLQPAERKAVEQQTDDFNQAIRPSLTEAARSTVRVWSGTRRVAYGTVVGDGTRVLTKWSQISGAGDRLLVESHGGETRGTRLLGMYGEEDLALLEITGRPLTPVRWSQAEIPIGSFVAVPQPDGRPAACGVVSVAARSLRESDQAFLGITGDIEYREGGVKIAAVEAGSGAQEAGLKPGDVVWQVGDRKVSGVLELRNSLLGRKPGDQVVVRYGRDGKESSTEVRLGNRPDFGRFDGRRLEYMKRMGTKISRVAEDFPSAVQTDMRLQPDQAGGPVVNLQGEVVGIALARADRTRSFFMTAREAQALLDRPVQDPSLAGTREPDRKARAEERPGRRQRSNPEADEERPRIREERLRQRLEEMQQLMDFMRREMEMLDPGP